MIRPSMTMILGCAVLGFACGDDGSGDATTSASTSGSSTEGQTDPPSSSTTTADPDTSTGPVPGTSSSSETGTVDSTGASTGMETDTAGVDCDAIPPGPLAAEVVFEPGVVFDGTEDIAFDGQGNVAGKNGNDVLLVAADGSMVDSWPDQGPGYGLRWRANGQLLAAKFQINEIRIVNEGGPLITMAGGVNGLWPDFDGNVWFTNGNSVRRINADDTVDAIVTGGDAASSNGVILDPDRSVLFYSSYGLGQVRSVEIMGDGSPGAVSMIATIPGAAIDGLNLDACGNLYAMDQSNASLYRIFLDPVGAAIGEPEQLIEEFPSNVANAVWGSGPGWDPMSLYAAGFPGGIYRVEVGVPGAPYPTP